MHVPHWSLPTTNHTILPELCTIAAVNFDIDHIMPDMNGYAFQLSTLDHSRQLLIPSVNRASIYLTSTYSIIPKIMDKLRESTKKLVHSSLPFAKSTWRNGHFSFYRLNMFKTHCAVQPRHTSWELVLIKVGGSLLLSQAIHWQKLIHLQKPVWDPTDLSQVK